MREAEFCKLMISMTNLGAVSNLLGGKGHAASERNTTARFIQLRHGLISSSRRFTRRYVSECAIMADYVLRMTDY